MNIVKIISEHKKTKRQTRIDKNGVRSIVSGVYRSRVGFVEAIVRGEDGYLYTAHLPKPRGKK